MVPFLTADGDVLSLSRGVRSAAAEAYDLAEPAGLANVRAGLVAQVTDSTLPTPPIIRGRGQYAQTCKPETAGA